MIAVRDRVYVGSAHLLMYSCVVVQYILIGVTSLRCLDIVSVCVVHVLCPVL